ADIVANSSAFIVAAGDAIIFKDKILVAANRSTTTDYAAPALNVPTFRRTFSGTPAAPDPASVFPHNVFSEGGTSLSSAIRTRPVATVASALDYWDGITPTGVTVDGYLTTPAGVRQLNFGPHAILDLHAYANPDGINSILQWTAVPITDAPNLNDNL